MEEKSKICGKCNLPKNLDQFCKRSDTKDGLHRYCKECMNNQNKIDYSENKEEHNQRTKQWHKNNRDYHNKKMKEHYNNNKDYYRKWTRNKMKIDPLFRLKHSINALINHHLKRGKTQRSLKYLGCNINEYKIYLESQFTPKMNWENYGTYWEIDHKFPLAKGGSFNYKNTRPLTITENRIKSDKILI